MSMGAPACDVTPRTEGFLWGKGGSRGRGGSEIHSYSALARADACHWSRQPLCTGPASLSLAASGLRN